MGVFNKVNIKDQYLAGRNTIANTSFSTLADNTCLNAIENGDDKVYLVTSASLYEGKTTVSINLALQIAKRGRKVLLIDANLRNPTIGDIFNLKGLPGFTQVICNGKLMTDLIVSEEKYNFDIMPSGKIDHEPFEVMTSPKLVENLELAKKLYDFVILDSPAVNIHMDSLHLCPVVDQIIFVILANYTEKNKVNIAKQRILNVEGKILGMVLNREKYSFLHNGK
ncbi:capsular exopolysaccharide family [Candidatus Scalindua japonica]|uniref:non-specific protein-tyrosine kinase n=1 Tax=Candidatus Scalindua japonica TaxID=1284222 RepID=A0A286TWZ5_9BACT|nr:CpsD/CapB family tyrosine-protein kinase [Candidatus Scalindua japonica]GAX60413.1 capsular exopolysaccharide family [Candidatus Scalindua japonica]